VWYFNARVHVFSGHVSYKQCRPDGRWSWDPVSGLEVTDYDSCRSTVHTQVPNRNYSGISVTNRKSSDISVLSEKKIRKWQRCSDCSGT